MSLKTSYSVVILNLLLATLSFEARAQPTEENAELVTVIRNIALPERAGLAEGTRVSVQITDGVLDVITEDSIPGEDTNFTYDARDGLINGQIEIGQPASFLILNANVDPVEALLDTSRYADFVVVQGEIVKNSLPRIFGTTVEERRVDSQGWLAYTPPPRISLTTDANSNNWNRFNTRAVNGVFAAAVLLDRQRWLEQDDRSQMQVGDLDESSGGEIRGLRVGAVGTFNFDQPWVWTVAGATHAFDQGFDQVESDDFTLFDVRLDIPLFDIATFSIGKQKEPISMERLMSMVDLPQQERAAISDALLPSRNVGLVVAGNPISNNFSLAGGVFNNFLDKDQPNSMSDNSTQYVGRATWVPYASEDESTLLHLGMGLRYSDVKEGASTSTVPEFNNSPDFLIVDPFNADKLETLQLEASLRSRSFWLHSEYVSADIDAPALGNPKVDGYHATLSWIASGEMRPYNRSNGTFRPIPISRNVNQNGWGALEFSARYSHSNLTDGLINGGEMDIWSAGVNWWLSPLFSVNLNYRYTTLDSNGVVGHSSGFNSRIMLLLQ